MAKLKLDGIKYYTPHEGLVSHVKKELQHMKSTKSREKRSSGGEETQDYNLHRMKVNYLDKHIFQAMADLVFFFQAIAEHKEFQEVYEDDIKDLLGIRRNDPYEQQYGFMFINLISAMLALRTNEYEFNTDPALKLKPKQDFTLKLNNELQELLWRKLSEYVSDIFSNTNSRNAVVNDVGRVLGWTGMLASGIPDEHDIIRTERTETRIKHTFEKSAKHNRPARTFDFNTTNLLGDEK